MRVFFNSMTLPKRAAKRIKNFYCDDHYSPENNTFKLSTAQTYTSWLLGYDNWHELEEVTKNPNTIPSKLDEELTDSEFLERIEFQLVRLKKITPIRGNLALEAIYKFQVSSSTGNNTQFHDYSNNRFYYSEEFDEIGLFESVRSLSKHDEIYDIGDGDLDLWGLVSKLKKIVDEQPENLLAYSYYLSALYNHGVIIHADSLNDMADVILDLIPSEVTGENKNWLSWYRNENKNFMRTMFNLGLLYCKDKEYDSGFALIYSTIVTNDIFNHDLENILKELKCIRKYKNWVKSVDETKTLKLLIEKGVKKHAWRFNTED